MADREPIAWITVHGRRVPIFEGESKADAVKRVTAKDPHKSMETPQKQTKEQKVIQSNEDKKEKQIEHNTQERERINSKSSGKADEMTQTEHRNAVKELSSDKYGDGTYDISTRKTVDFPNGYQVTFCQIGDNYSDKEYAGKVNECLALSSDDKTYAGKFEGTPEISFHCADRKQAEVYARANNQISIWDWKQSQIAKEYSKKYGDDDPRTIEAWVKCEIKTGGTGRRKGA